MPQISSVFPIVVLYSSQGFIARFEAKRVRRGVSLDTQLCEPKGAYADLQFLAHCRETEVFDW